LLAEFARAPGPLPLQEFLPEPIWDPQWDYFTQRTHKERNNIVKKIIVKTFSRTKIQFLYIVTVQILAYLLRSPNQCKDRNLMNFAKKLAASIIPIYSLYNRTKLNANKSNYQNNSLYRVILINWFDVKQQTQSSDQYD
jgi:hypothetical protein